MHEHHDRITKKGDRLYDVIPDSELNENPQSWMIFRGTLCSTTMDGPRLGGGGVCQRDLDPSPPHNLDLCLFNT